MAPVPKKLIAGEQKKFANHDMVFFTKTRFSAAQINAGAELLPATYGYKYRMVDAAMVAAGGAASGATDVRILATQAGVSVALLAIAIAGLTQNTMTEAGMANAAILAASASFDQCDVQTPITIGKTGGSLAGATSVDVFFWYSIDRA